MDGAHGRAVETACSPADSSDEGKHMSGKVDQVKGRIKEAAGVLADDDELKREGKIDQLAGKVKDAAAKAIEKVKDAATSANDRR